MADENSGGLGTGWLLAGGFLLVVAIAVIAAIVIMPSRSPNPDQTDPTGDAGESPPPNAEPTPEESRPGGEIEPCDLDEANSDFPATAPEFQWEEHPSGVVLPVSDEHGPVVRDGNVWRCSSQTPSGAAFGGLGLLASFTHGWTEAAEDSPAARELAEDLEQLLSSDEATVPIHHRGFRILDSNAESATVEYWFHVSGQDTDLFLRIPLTWNEDANDWRLNFASASAVGSGVVEDTTQYTEWKN